jgi:hypothetical protein
VAAWLIDLGARHVVGRLAGKNADRLQTLVVVSTAARCRLRGGQCCAAKPETTA